MPYIKPITRKVLDPAIQLFFDRIKEDDFELLKSGELNYVLTKIIHWWILNKGVSYQNLHDARGILDDVKTEFTRQIMDPYEDEKKEENGFISNLDRITLEEKQAVWKCEKCKHEFLDNEFHQICGSEITYYECPKCGANRTCCIKIRKEKE